MAAKDLELRLQGLPLRFGAAAFELDEQGEKLGTEALPALAAERLLELGQGRLE